MDAIRRAWCIMASALALAGGAAAAPAARGEAPGGTQFPQLLAQARRAYQEGDEAAARARLRDAARLVSGERFHRLVLEAASAYDAGRLGAARGRLKKATHLVNPWFWVILGLVAQALFTGRFLVQWLASERQKRSVVPISFWYLSISGSLLLLTYAIWRQDPVFILGQACGSFIYVRNLTLIYRGRAHQAAPSEEPGT